MADGPPEWMSDASGAGAPGVPAPAGAAPATAASGPGYHSRFKNASLSYILRVLRVVNVIMSVLCGTVGVLVMITFPGISSMLMAVYLIIFSLVLLLFELRISSFDKMLRGNFGFMFSYWGRFCFLCFMSTLCFSLDVVFGYIIGACMVINAAFNCYVILLHPEFSSKLGGSADPTQGGGGSAQQEAQQYAVGAAMNNPELVGQAIGSMANANRPQGAV